MNQPLGEITEGCSYCKEDNTLGGELGFVVLLILTLYILGQNIQSLRNLMNQRKKMNVQKLFTINFIILVFLVASIVLYGDGLVGLFTENGYLDWLTWNIIQSFTTCCLQIIFTVGYYNWSTLFATVYEIPKNKVRSIALVVLFIFCLLFGGTFVAMCFIFAKYGSPGSSTDVVKERDYLIVINVLSIGILANSALFIVSCNILIRKLRAIYYFSSEKVAQKMRKLIVFTIAASILRGILDFSFSYFDIPGFIELKNNILYKKATTEEQIIWFIYMCGFFVICNIIPTRFMLMNFSPIIIRNNTLQSYNSEENNFESTENFNKQLLSPGDKERDDLERTN